MSVSSRGGTTEFPEVDLADNERAPGDVVVLPLNLRVVEEVPVAPLILRRHDSLLLLFQIKGKGFRPKTKVDRGGLT